MAEAGTAELTDVERAVWQAWEDSGKVELLGLTLPGALPFLREIIQRTAFHEAGHVVAAAYVATIDGHDISVSLTPGGNLHGVWRSLTASSTYAMLRRGHIDAAGVPRDLLRHWVYGGTIHTMAGPYAGAKVTGDIEDAFSEFDEANTGNCLSCDSRSCDHITVWQGLAVLYPNCGKRMLNMFDRAWRLTGELLDKPEVWQTVIRLAEQLLKVGTIADNDLLDALEPVLWKGIPWMKRVAPVNRKRPLAEGMAKL